MKKIIAVLLAFVLMLSFAACSGKGDGNDTPKESTTAASDDASQSDSSAAGDVTDASAQTSAAVVTRVANNSYKDGEITDGKSSPPRTFDSMERTLWYNLLCNDQGKDYVGKDFKKKGTFTILYDEVSKMTRYYVWGYEDATMCQDWEWEFVPADEKGLPPVGSFVEVEGTFNSDEKALDKYWITDATVKTLQEYNGSKSDVDMTTMGPTLEFVQVSRMLSNDDTKAAFEGKTVTAYGRVLGTASVQHPCEDGRWSIDFITDDEVPAIGEIVVVSGTLSDGALSDATVTLSSEY